MTNDTPQPQTIDEILQRVFDEGFDAAVGGVSIEGAGVQPSERDKAKQAIREASERIIGGDVSAWLGYEHMSVDDLNKEENFHMKSMIMRRASQNVLRYEQRKRLDDFMEDASNKD